MSKRLFGWDPDHLCDLTVRKLNEAQSDYFGYLGPGSPLTTPTETFFIRVKEIVEELVKTAGALSPSVRALGGTVPVCNFS